MNSAPRREEHGGSKRTDQNLRTRGGAGKPSDCEIVRVQNRPQGVIRLSIGLQKCYFLSSSSALKCNAAKFNQTFYDKSEFPVCTDLWDGLYNHFLFVRAY